MRHAAVLLAVLLALPRPASATWSVTAVDPRTREVGIAGASCTPNVMGIAGVVPGRGVIAAQALTNGAARQRGVEMLRAGASPAEIVRTVTDSVFDPVHPMQQYGVAALGHAPAAPVRQRPVGRRQKPRRPPAPALRRVAASAAQLRVRRGGRGERSGAAIRAGNRPAAKPTEVPPARIGGYSGERVGNSG